MISKLLIFIIKFYQKYISPVKKYPTCKYYPTCSHYGIESIKNRGALEGSVYTVWRVLRCNPFSGGGYDPPPKPRVKTGKYFMKKSLLSLLTILVVSFIVFSAWGETSKTSKKSSDKVIVKTKKTVTSNEKTGIKSSTSEKKNGTDPGKTTKDATKVNLVNAKSSKDASKVTTDSTKTDTVANVKPVKKTVPEIKAGTKTVTAPPIPKYQTLKIPASSVPIEKDPRLHYENKLYKFSFTTMGAVFSSFILKYSSYREYVVPKINLKKGIHKKVDQQMEMIKTWSPAFLPFQFSMEVEKLAQSLDQHTKWFLGYKFHMQKWKLISRTANKADNSVKWDFVLLSDFPCTKEKLAKKVHCYPFEIHKIYTAYEGRYDIDLNIIVKNISDTNIRVKRSEFQVTSLHEGESSRGFFNPVSLQKEAICYHADGVSVQPYDTILHGKKSGGCMGGCGSYGCSKCSCQRTPSSDSIFSAGSRWAGIDARYFLTVIMKNYSADDGGCKFWGYSIKEINGYGIIGANMDAGESKPFKPGKSILLPFKLYIGPKDINYLEKVRIYDAPPEIGKTKKATDNPKLQKSVDFGLLGIIGRPMIWFLKVVYGFVGNWGLAIIFLTMLIKLVTLYFTTKSMRSMKRMASLKPEIERLQKMYPNDKEKLNQEMMALYKKHGVNPLGGCLPMFLQMPIYIAWYQGLMASVELYRAPLFGWINDLTARDPYFILPILMGAFMFLQQKMSPTAADNQQAKIMMYMMPIMFTGIMLFLPSGLTLYILTNTILGLVHQWYLNHTDDFKIA